MPFIYAQLLTDKLHSFHALIIFVIVSVGVCFFTINFTIITLELVIIALILSPCLITYVMVTN